MFHTRTRFLLAFSVISLQSCAYDPMLKDFAVDAKKLKAPPFHLVSLGMSKDQVVTTLGKPDQLIGARNIGGQLTETWEYHRFETLPGPDRIGERYQVSFTDGLLTSYDSSGDFRQQVNLR